MYFPGATSSQIIFVGFVGGVAELTGSAPRMTGIKINKPATILTDWLLNGSPRPRKDKGPRGCDVGPREAVLVDIFDADLRDQLFHPLPDPVEEDAH